MGVKVRRKKSKWCLVVDYRGRRLTRAISSDRKVADEVRRQVEARLALGDLSIFEKPTSETLTFEKYADRWLKDHASIECKPSTYRSYEQLLRIHIKPRFGTKKIVQISRESIKKFLAEMSQATRVVDTQTGETALKYSRNTLRQMVCALRSVLNAAVEDGIVQSNPASRIGKFAKTERPAHKAQAMTRKETEQFLDAINQVCEEWYPFFLTALRAGLRKGELIALKWGDIQFGASVDDPNRFILVQRNWAAGAFTTPKNGKSRRVDLSRGLREVLVGLRDKHLLEAFMAGKASIADDLMFPCSVWDENEKVWRHGRGSEPLKPDNIAVRYMQPALEKAGLRGFRFHDLRHTFGSLLIRDGASLTYVKEQMGHSSIQITVDTYGHLVPGADISWVDRLDARTEPQPSAT